MAKDDFSINPKYRRPGWYRDPLPEFNGQRYWDGDEWTAQTRPRPDGVRSSASGTRTGTSNTIGWVVASVIGLTLLISVLVGVGSGGDDEDADAAPGNVGDTTTAAPADPVASSDDDETAKKACQNSVKNQLKDPDSAEFRSVKITSRDPAQGWTVVGEFNANNSFGGKVGYTVFTCSATMKDSETVTATAVLME